jgi:hypothetical protein
MKRLLLAAGLMLAASASPAAAKTLCVGPSAGCFPTVQAAVTAANDGDTITIAPGTYAGGVTIAKSVAIKGAGAGATTIQGGGPVLTIFRQTAPEGLSVSIDGVTVTGGVNNSLPDNAVTFGGGIAIPTSQLHEPPFNGTGATVTISNSVISGNTVRTDTAIPGHVFCGPLPCGFNSGGGIDNGGVLTLTNVRVTNNVAGSTAGQATLASSPSAGAIFSHFASTLTIRNSVISGNRAVATLPNGQSAVAGGISSDGALSIENSSISDNSAELTSNLGSIVDQNALAGGLHLGGCCDVPHPTVTIRNTVISGNRAVATSTGPDPVVNAFAGGLLVETPLLMERTVVRDNQVHATATAADAVADGGGIEVDADVTIRDSAVMQNSAVADAAHAALALGGGIANAGSLTLERTLVQGNRASAKGTTSPLPFGAQSGAFGGGIWVGSFGGPDTPQLSTTDTFIVANRASASPGFLAVGGGLFSDVPVSRTRTLIAANTPDQCHGC